MSLPAGSRLGPYEIQSALGAGGMGDVWKARDTRLDRTVAIKTIHGPFTDRFEREARAISALNHPHICTLYDIGEHEGAGYLVMELVEGSALAGPLPVADVLKYGAQICSALEAAHRKGIVHRDLKPANILVTKAGVKLLDFGLAKAGGAGGAGGEAQGTTLLTGAHTILGTPQYMAPEQIEGKDADARTDLFALGCVLYEVLTGQKAFEGKSPSSVMAAIIATEPRPMKTLQPLTPTALERAVMRCLAKDPEDRWQSARDLRAELEWIATAGDTSSTGAHHRTRRDSSKLPWTASVLLTVAAAAALALWWRVPVPQEPRSIAMEIAPPAGYTFDSVPLVSPDGRQLAFVARDQAGKPNAFVRRLDSTTVRPLSGFTGAFDLSAWSRDNREIAFFSGQVLKRVNIETGTVQTICECGRASPVLSWSQDGVILLSRSTGPLLRVSAAGGEPLPVTKLNEERQEYVHQNASFLRDGRHFIYFARSRQPQNDAILTGSLDTPVDQRAEPLLLSPSTAHYAGGSTTSDFILFARTGALIAQALDLRTMRLTGDPIQISPRIGFTGATTISASASTEGTVAFATESQGGPTGMKQFAWFERSGKLLAEVGQPASFREFSMTADEKRVAVTRLGNPNIDVWLMDLEHEAALTPVTTDPRPESYPTWSHDGATVLFSRGLTDDSVVVRKTFGARGAESLVEGVTGLILDVSPDGHSLLYQVKTDLWALTDGKAEALVQEPNSSDAITDFRAPTIGRRGAKFSPDGRWVAFVAALSTQPEVYVQGFPSGMRVQISSAGGTQPQWRRDGKELFYLGLDGRLMAVTITKIGAEFEYESAKPLFDTLLLGQNVPGYYAVSKDGQRFLMQIPDRKAGSAPFTIITNWLAASRR